MRDLGDVGAERVLAIGAHPDDAEFFAGGTLARFADLGARVAVVVCTDGGRGGRGIEDVARVRREEQARAAKAIGVAEVVHIDRPDGELVCDDALRAELVRALRRLRPDVVLTHDPTTLWQQFGGRTSLGHTDHRATGQAALDAIYPRAPNPNFFPEQLREPGLELWSPRELWLFDTPEPQQRVDIGGVFERKLEALRCHQSQGDLGMDRAARALAEALGGEGRLAEGFRPLRLRESRRRRAAPRPVV